MRSKSMTVLTLLSVALLAQTAAGVTDAQKCEAAKLKAAGKYNFCRLKAQAKAVKTGDSVDDVKCQEKFLEKFADAELTPSCPTTGDIDAIEIQVTTDADFIGLKLTGVRFVDNGDGTVTDTLTWLTWEQKDDLGGIHDKDNLYAWSTESPFKPNGAAFTDFLATLNGGTSSDGTAISGCFAGHCDWRLPTIAELQTILLEPYPCETDPCVDPTFGPTQGDYYWSTTIESGFPDGAWTVDFSESFLTTELKEDELYVRAVHGGL